MHLVIVCALLNKGRQIRETDENDIIFKRLTVLVFFQIFIIGGHQEA